ncbi:MAG: galactokinase family protein, partial [Propionibacteriaceae bacterium]|nr:galactokinase family protein [Propionibacteriaceae bacterium]
MTSGWRVPGRIEVLGKHTDYAGGDVLVCAVNQAVTATGTPRTDASVVARSSAFAEPVTLQPGAGESLPRGHWGRYLQVVVDRFTHVFGPLPGIDLELSSTLPLASGMSSSSALLVASALTWADAVGLPSTPAWSDLVGDCRLRLASFLASVENGRGFGELDAHAGVGTLGGSEDHLAMLCAED